MDSVIINPAVIVMSHTDEGHFKRRLAIGWIGGKRVNDWGRCTWTYIHTLFSAKILGPIETITASRFVSISHTYVAIMKTQDIGAMS